MTNNEVSGSTINVTSQEGHVGRVDRAAYCASKIGVEGMEKAKAVEWGGAGIRINTICPTFVRTSLTEQTFGKPARRTGIESKTKLGRIGEVEDMTEAIVLLASDASALVTGACILVDDVWTAD